MTMQLEMNLQDDAALDSPAEAIYTPAIRFKGFSGNWERYNFSDVSESFEYGLNAAATEYDGENKYIRITDINEKTRALDLNDLTSPNFDLSKAENYKLHLGDLLFARTGASVGKTYIYKKNDGVVYFAGFLIRAKLKNTVSSQFIFQSTLTEKYNKFIRLTSQRSGQPGVNAKEYGLCEIYLSQLEEQTAIGNYFQQLDSLIAQHQHKHTKLLNLKQALLQKMFPKQGASVPEVRFKGFSGDWEVKELGSIADLLTGNPFNSKNFKKTGFFLVRGMNVKRGYLDMSEDISEYWPTTYELEKFLLQKNDIVIQMDGALIGKSYAKIKAKNLPALLVQRVTRVRGKETNSEFIYQYIQRDFLKHISKIKTETAVPHLSLNDIRKLQILIPETRYEETKIGQLFQQLDHLITQQHALLTKLSNLKQAYLAKMFI